MKKSYFKIGPVPAILWGEPADRVYLFVHGKRGSREDAAGLAAIACAGGWQVLSIDLPEHGARVGGKDAFVPWRIVPELREVMAYLMPRWETVGLWAASIGAWFGMLAFQEVAFEKCRFVSPILDMERLIRGMMQWASVSEETLRREREIKTDFGETLSWEYLAYVRAHPILKWVSPTAILYPERDNLTERCAAEAFCARFRADLTVLEDGEHWIHTPEQVDALDRWTRSRV